MARRRRSSQRDYRDGLLFLAGLAGVVHETLLRDVDRPYLLAVFCAMLGLPLYLRSDEPPQPPAPREDTPA